MESERCGSAAFGIGGQRCGNQIETIVEPRGYAVHCSDEGARSAANHS
jgi:hypothetical protein